MPIFYTSKEFLKEARKINKTADIRVDPQLKDNQTYAVHGSVPVGPIPQRGSRRKRGR